MQTHVMRVDSGKKTEIDILKENRKTLQGSRGSKKFKVEQE
jgi:hypothetical protein